MAIDPAALAPEKPAPRVCADCKFWKKDYGMWCFNGWTGSDRDDGHCMVAPGIVRRQGQDVACQMGERW